MKIYSILINNDTILEYLQHIENFTNIIFSCYNSEIVEITNSILDIMNALCWVSIEGYNLVISALVSFKNKNKCKYKFEPFTETLKLSKNIIMIENIGTFINTLIESHIEDNKRVLTRAEFLSAGIKEIYEVFFIIIFIINNNNYQKRILNLKLQMRNISLMNVLGKIFL